MKVVLDADIIFEGHVPVTDTIKQYYERIYNDAIKIFMADLYIDDVDEIVVTDQLPERVKTYQREHGMLEELTDNEFGRVSGKTLYDKKTGRQVVFLNAEEAIYLLDDDLLDKMCKDDESYSIFKMRRDRIINLLAHELSHAEYNSLTKMKTEFPCKNFFDKFLADLVIIMFEEYYACRRASEVSIPSQNEYIKDTIVDIEVSVKELVNQYRNNELIPAIFRSLFLERLHMALNEMCYLIGDINSNKYIETELKNTKIYAIVNSFNKTFSDLYNTALSKREILIPLYLRSEVLKYYNLFNIDIVADSGGTYIKYID